MPEEECPFCPCTPSSTDLDGLRTARRGSAAGPAGATSEHLRIVFYDYRRMPSCCTAPLSGLPVLNSLPQCSKVSGSDAWSRFANLTVGSMRSLSVTSSGGWSHACSPNTSRRSFNKPACPVYGLGTRAGTEAVSRLLRAATEACPRATVLSVDAVGAFDHVSRDAMLGGLLARRELHPFSSPSLGDFYSSPSVYTWWDDDSRPRDVSQGEGEQGDPLMPALYALVQHDALCDLQHQLR